MMATTDHATANPTGWLATWRVNSQGDRTRYATPCPAQGIAVYNPSATPITIYMYQTGPASDDHRDAYTMVVGAKRYKAMPVPPYTYLEIEPVAPITSEEAAWVSAYETITPADVSLEKVSTPDLWIDDDVYNPTEPVQYTAPSGGTITIQPGTIAVHLRIATGYYGALVIEPPTGLVGGQPSVTLEFGHNVGVGGTDAPLVLAAADDLVIHAAANAQIGGGTVSGLAGTVMLGEEASLNIGASASVDGLNAIIGNAASLSIAASASLDSVQIVADTGADIAITGNCADTALDAAAGATISLDGYTSNAAIRADAQASIVAQAALDITSSRVYAEAGATIDLYANLSDSAIHAGPGALATIYQTLNNTSIDMDKAAQLTSYEEWYNGAVYVGPGAYYRSELSSTTSTPQWYNTSIKLDGGANLTLMNAPSWYVYGGQLRLAPGAVMTLEGTSAGVGVEVLAIDAGAGSESRIYLGDAYAYQVIHIDPAGICDLGTSTAPYTGSYGTDSPTQNTISYTSANSGTVAKLMHIWDRRSTTSRWIMVVNGLNETTGSITFSPYDSAADAALGSPTSPSVAQAYSLGTLAAGEIAVLDVAGTLTQFQAGDSLVVSVGSPTTAATSGDIYVLTYQTIADQMGR
jgi:hypothetical protein